jgi:hypothetical protein
MGFLRVLLGEEARAGFNASAPTALASTAPAFAGAAAFVLADDADGVVPRVIAVVGLALVTLGLSGIGLSLGIMVFMRPRRLVPPSLRGQRGYAAALSHAWSTRHTADVAHQTAPDDPVDRQV